MLRQVAAFGVTKSAVPRGFRTASPRSFRLAVYSKKDVSPREAQSAVKEGATYLDVRTEEEFRGRRVADAINVPFMVSGGTGLVPSDDFAAQIQSRVPDKSTKLVVACQLGGRSAKAASKLAELGYTDVSNMLGGLNAWLAEELPVEG